MEDFKNQSQKTSECQMAEQSGRTNDSLPESVASDRLSSSYLKEYHNDAEDPEGTSHSNKKKKKKKRKTKSASSSSVAEDAQNGDPTSKRTHVPSERETTNVSTADVDAAGSQPQAKKKKNKKKKKKPGTTNPSHDAKTNDGHDIGPLEAVKESYQDSVEAPLSPLKDDANEELEHKPDKSLATSAYDQGHSIKRQETLIELRNSEGTQKENGLEQERRSPENFVEVKASDKNSSPGSSHTSTVENEEDFAAATPEASKVTKAFTSTVKAKHVGATPSDSMKANHERVPDVEEAGTDSDSEDNSTDLIDNEGRNIQSIFKLVYGVGLRALRKLFMEIHPSWSNTRRDAASLDKGTMHLGKEEKASFKKGDINEWDFSLMTSVLMFSTTCELEISKRPGYTAALRELKKCRNKLLGHPSTDKMTDAEFNCLWPVLSRNFVTLGADEDDIARLKLKSEKVLVAAEYYRELYLAERSKYAQNEKLDSMDSKLDKITAIITSQSRVETATLPEEESEPKWDEWLKFRDAVGDFDTQKNQYILVTDGVPDTDLELYSILKGIAWKVVLDFDPTSEEKGFYREFTSKSGEPMSNLVSMFTPEELNKSGMKSLFRQIDPKRIQWLFVNGRTDDRNGVCKDFPDWEASSVKGVNRLFACISDPDIFDTLKPVICLILPISRHIRPFLQVTLSRLIENFQEHNLTLLSISTKNSSGDSEKLEIQSFDLSPRVLNLGLKAMFGKSNDQKLRMPTSHAGVPVQLSQRQYLYIKEFLEVLYIGCEHLPQENGKPCESQGEEEKFLEEQRKSFLSGNEISFASLFDNHDARREIEKDIQIHVQRLLDQGLTRPMIVEIRHSPGAGGTTIARRVLWDLHKAFPCVLTGISSHHYSDEDNIFANDLADRIESLEEICNTTPLILFDGKQSGAVEGLSNKLTRILQSRGKRALILRCLRGLKATSGAQESSYVHKVFHVNVKLEESLTDLNEFKSKYKEYLDTIDGSLVKKQVVSGLCRVFHFPLLSMMEEFRPKLEKIIEDTFKELGGIQQEIAVVVAFLQKYANFPTPAVLLQEAFLEYIRVPNKKVATYDDVKRLFSEYLMNLMIPAKPTTRGGVKPPESYTFQHPIVADLVLKRVYREQKRDLFGIVDQFLQFPIYRQETLLPLLHELFIYNKKMKGQTEKLKFSLLFEELNVIDPGRAAEIFCKAAEKVNHPVMYGNAARFCARKEPPSFPKAKDLIERALQVHKSTSQGKYKNLCHVKGLVLYFELKYMINVGEIEDLETLEEKATRVLQAYREARDFPPTYPHPLIGEVEVWLQCITWIMNNFCNHDTVETFDFVTKFSPRFFRNCVSESFCLLDIVDGIVESVAHLADPVETKRLSHNLRLSLMKTFPKRFSSHGKRKAGDDVVQACRAICSSKHFQASSQLELKRLQAQYMLSSSESVESLKKESLQFLLKLLEELVLQEDEYSFTRHLLNVCTLVTGKQGYTLEQGLLVCDKWSAFSDHNCLPHFYQMAIYFLKILDGNALEFLPKYTQALSKCQEKSENHLRRPYATLFVGKEGQGMCRLISFKSLLRGETDYSTDNFEKVSRFWHVESRKKLLECKGRIKVKQSSRHGKSLPYIELGNIELYVAKYAEIGKVERDFASGDLVYFVVSFNLQGPVANGITRSPHDSSRD